MPIKLGNEKHYEPREVATVIGRGYQTTLRRIHNGEIPAQKVMAGYLVSHKSLVSYLAEVESLPANVIEMRLKSST